MTAAKMTLAEALDVAIASTENVWIVHGTFDEAQCRQAAAVLREFREKGLPFYEAALDYNELAARSFAEGDKPNMLHAMAHETMRAAYRRLTTEGE